MSYQITITKREPNPKYSPCQDGRYRGPEEPEFLSERALEFTLTEQEFQAVKKAMLEVM